MPRKNDGKSSGEPRHEAARPRGQAGNATNATGGSGTGAGAGAGLRLRRSDDALASEIREILTKDPELDATDIEVDVEGGAVTLTGYVESSDAKLLAEELVETLPGVREVHNHLKVAR